MAGNAQIGALRVDLGLNSAQFTKGLQNATTGLAKFGAIAARSFAVVAAGATLAAGALGVAVKGAIDHADALGKAAQKAGVTVEALSRLEYAAKLSDVSLEGLTGGLQKLSKGMADAAGGKGPAAAFKALGIAVTDARGQLRGSDEVMSEIADRFSRLEDGATKTALAMQIFGKSGAELIPLLNSGADGLAAMADESDRLGNTISTTTAKAAEKFNDTLTTIQVAMQGVINKIISDDGFMGALQAFADTLASPEFQAAVQQLAVWIIDAMNAITQVVVGAVNAVKDFRNLFGGNDAPARYTGADLNNAMTSLGSQLGSHQSNPWRRNQDPSSFYSGFNFTGGKMDVADPASGKKPLVIPPFDTGGAVASLKPLDLGIDTTIEKVTTLADSIGGPLTNAISGFVDAIMSGENPLESFVSSLADIGKALLNQGIQGLVSSLLGGVNLGGMFGGGGSFVGAGFGSYGSFDGGGFTGYGPRSGGMDGNGGQLAMLHPNETVLDHTKGQGGGGLTMNFNITGSAQDAAAIANLVRVEARSMYKQLQRNPDR